MQGFIININKAKDEDLVVTVLTEKKLKTLYRFYGARHSNIHLGYKLDFEAQHSLKSNIAQLRNVFHLSYSWLLERDKHYIWQQFCKLLHKHLKDVEEIDDFYFKLMDEGSNLFHKQNPKRVIIELYIKLLEHEGRLHDDFKCFICEEEIEKKLSLARAFLPAHERCMPSDLFFKNKIAQMFEQKSTLYMENEEIEKLWRIVLEGF